jgi:hypothetical protein
MQYLKVNTPNVVHETIDGETILLDLNSGNYFSLDGTGALIWEYIEKTGNWKKTIEILAAGNAAQADKIEETVTAFVTKLVEENLVVEGGGENTDADITELESGLKKAAADYAALKVNKYSDMQDLLLLDPIHEVDEKGWPESKENTEDITEEENI